MENHIAQYNKFKTCSIILAAGKSSRMGRFKPLMQIGGVPAIKRIIDTNKNAGVEDIIVVTGHTPEKLERLLVSEDVVIAHNSDYEQGMFTSIKSGLKKAKEIDDFSHFMLFLVDVPLIPEAVIKQLIQLASKDKNHFMVPSYHGKKGHPLVIPKNYLDEILKHDGTNGLKGVTARYDHEIIRMETDKEGVVLDMDRPKDYKEILSYFDESKSMYPEQNIWESTGFNGRLLLVRHGSTQQHKGKIFMGQVDIPLSEKGINEAKKCAQQLLDLNPETTVIYSSDLIRAKKTAEIIYDEFNSNNNPKKLIFSHNLAEMNLGDWDGKFIDDIKNDSPDEYKKRGENILTYKRYPDGENYYDLRYRVNKELTRIFENAEDDEDIIIVSHKGVISAIRDIVLDLDPKESWGFDPDRGSVTIIRK